MDTSENLILSNSTDKQKLEDIPIPPPPSSLPPGPPPGLPQGNALQFTFIHKKVW